MSMRPDIQLISRWIKPGARILDLGCGDGTLLAHLQADRGVSGYGLEIDPDRVLACVAQGVNVIQTDLNEGLGDFDDDSFDFVIMNQALQEVAEPLKLLQEMLRIGREGIVTFPNFGHWRSRLSLILGGHMPRTDALPEAWYETDNIHLCTVSDFEQLCRDEGIKILDRRMMNREHESSISGRALSNLFAEFALYRFKRR